MLVFDPVAQLIVFPVFHIRSSSMSMLEINNILKLLIPNFVMMVSFFRQCLSFTIFCYLWLCNIASVFLFGFIIAYLFLYIVVFFFFGCFHFLCCNGVRIQFISLRWLIQDIYLPLYIYCVPISNDHPIFFFILLLCFSLKFFSRITSPFVSIIIYTSLSNLFIRPVYQTSFQASLLGQFIIPVYYTSLSDQFIKPVYQSSLSEQFIRTVYQTSLSSQFIIPVYQASLLEQFIRPVY